MAKGSDWQSSLITWGAIIGAIAAFYNTKLGQAVESKLTGYVTDSSGATPAGGNQLPAGVKSTYALPATSPGGFPDMVATPSLASTTPTQGKYYTPNPGATVQSSLSSTTPSPVPTAEQNQVDWGSIVDSSPTPSSLPLTTLGGFDDMATSTSDVGVQVDELQYT